MDGLLADLSFKADLNSAKDIGGFILALTILLQGSKKDEDGMGRSIGKELEIVGGVLVMRRDEETHQTEQKLFSCLVVGEQGLTINQEELAIVGVGVGVGHTGGDRSS